MVNTEIILTYDDYPQDIIEMKLSPKISQTAFLKKIFKKIGVTRAKKLGKISAAQYYDYKGQPLIKWLLRRKGIFLFTTDDFDGNEYDDALKKRVIKATF